MKTKKSLNFQIIAVFQSSKIPSMLQNIEGEENHNQLSGEFNLHNHSTKSFVNYRLSSQKVLLIMNKKEWLPLAPKYILQNELPSGFLGHTALVKGSVNDNFFICKTAEKSRIGSAENILKFKERLTMIRNISDPHIITYNEIIETDDMIYMIRDFIVNGPISESLTELPNSDDPFTIYEHWRTVCKSIYNLHSKNIYPNIIKPNNIFLVNDSIFITDLILPPVDIDLMMHTPNPLDIGFLAPEFFNQGKTGDFSDLWSLGVLLAFMATKSLPFTTKNLFSMLQQINSGRYSLSASLPKFIEGQIRLLLQVDPNNRKLESLSPDRNNGDFSNARDTKNKIHKVASGSILNTGIVILQEMTGSKGNLTESPSTKSINNSDSTGFVLRQRSMAPDSSNEFIRNSPSSPNVVYVASPNKNVK